MLNWTLFDSCMLLTCCLFALQKLKVASQDLEVVRAEVANLKEAVKFAEVSLFYLMTFTKEARRHASFKSLMLSSI